MLAPAASPSPLHPRALALLRVATVRPRSRQRPLVASTRRLLCQLRDSPAECSYSSTLPPSRVVQEARPSESSRQPKLRPELTRSPSPARAEALPLRPHSLSPSPSRDGEPNQR